MGKRHKKDASSLRRAKIKKKLAAMARWSVPAERLWEHKSFAGC